MYENILSTEQKQLLPFIQSFKKEYYLVAHLGQLANCQENYRKKVEVFLKRRK